YIAILRILNPTANSDVFYKLDSECCTLGFQVKSWKGRVRKNSHVDVTIAANIKSASPGGNPDVGDDLPALSLEQLCQTKFSLEMTECLTKWRPGFGGAHRNDPNLMVKIELHCITREILLQIQNETPLNMDNVSESCDDIEQRIAKYVAHAAASLVTEQDEEK